jgi:oxygen-dependent protoporphyrinogen oxidase
MKRVVVVGGGIAGLTTALHLRDRAGAVGVELDLEILEASDRPGGNIETDRTGGFLDNVPATPALVRRLGLEGSVQKADEAAAKRYLYRNGKLHLLPTGPLGFLRSPVLSLPGRLRVLAEPFASGRPEGVDESIFQFASRRIGDEAASVLIDAMVSGVFAGDVRRLSLASSFPRMAAMESEHGGLVKAMIARMRERRRARRAVEARRRAGEDVEELVRPGGPAGPGGTLTSFREGLDTLPLALARELGDRVRLGVRATGIRRGGSGPPWVVEMEGGEMAPADAVVVAVPSPRAAPLLRGLDPDLAAVIDEIPTAGLSVVALGYAAESMGGPPDGFGFLVPRGQGLRILGCLWDSSIFPGRGPRGRVLLRVMVGGAHDPEAVEEDQEVLVSQVRRELHQTMGVEGEPLLAKVYRWPLGIGQYTVGHRARIRRMEKRLGRLGPLWVAGSSFYGISMNACIEKAGEQAVEILETLGEPPPARELSEA